jgi:hypothetical protein
MSKFSDFLNEADFDSADMNLLNSLTVAAKPKSEQPEFIVTYGDQTDARGMQEKYCWTLEDAMDFAQSSSNSNPQVVIWHGVEPLHTWINGRQIR